jgi:hypothetical protein
MNKTRDVNNPYEIYLRPDGWEWRVLKKYQRPDKEAENEYARWFTAVKSPFTYDSYDMGDTYRLDILQHAVYKVPEEKMKEHLQENVW